MKSLAVVLLLTSFVSCSSGSGGYIKRTPLPKIQAGTMAQDWRNDPDWANYIDYDYVTISTRAQKNGGPVGNNTPAAENLSAAGVKVLFVIFPCFFWYNGQALPEGDWERKVQDLAVSQNAVLKNSDGSWVVSQPLGGCYMVDFRNREFASALAQLVTDFNGVGQGILEHGACDPVGWNPLFDGSTPDDVKAWSDGFHFYFSELRRLRPDWEILGVCDKVGSWGNEVFDGTFFENVGGSLNPVGQKTYDQLATAGDRNVVGMYDTSSLSLRRGAAVMAILWDALFLFGSEATVAKNIEHFTIHYGAFDKGPKEISPGVWERVGTHGFVVGNISSAPYTYTDPIDGSHMYTIPANDGLAVQFKNINTDAMLVTWVTNEGV